MNTADASDGRRPAPRTADERSKRRDDGQPGAVANASVTAAVTQNAAAELARSAA